MASAPAGAVAEWVGSALSRPATPWHVVFLAALLVSVVFDPIIRTWFEPPPYGIQLVSYAQSIGVPAGRAGMA